MRNALWVCGLTLAMTTAGCGDDVAGPTEPEDVQFAAVTGVNLSQMTRLASGLYVQNLTPGTGTRQVSGNTRFIAQYTGWLPDGRVFDSGTFSQGLLPSQLVPGFGEGVLGMRVGEKRKFVIPSRLGYADAPPQGSGIPVNSVLVFDVTIVSIL